MKKLPIIALVLVLLLLVISPAFAREYNTRPANLTPKMFAEILASYLQFGGVNYGKDLPEWIRSMSQLGGATLVEVDYPPVTPVDDTGDDIEEKPPEVKPPVVDTPIINDGEFEGPFEIAT